MRNSYVYIITNKNRTVFYTGVTSNLARRMSEHKSGVGSVFCKRYNVNTLIYYESFTDIRVAITREKQIEEWKRAWKIELVKTRDPEMKDLLKKN